MFISRKYKFLFIHVAKAAGSTISIMFKDIHELTGKQREDPQPFEHHMSASGILERFPECRNYFKFAITRNPFDRILSGYSEFKNDPLRNNCLGLKPWPTNMESYSNFDEFCKDLKSSEWIKDPHFVHQSSLLYEKQTLMVDYIAKQENLFNDLLKIKDKIGVNEKILKQYILNQHHRITRGIHRKWHYSHHYNPETRKIVEDIYQIDFKNFGYKWEEIIEE
jgi:hypothetical protein